MWAWKHPHHNGTLTYTKLEGKVVFNHVDFRYTPTFTHAENSLRGRIKAYFMRLAGFPLHSRWTSEEYLSFLRQNGWRVRKSAVLKASFPLTYAECVKSEV